jgi:hypothetical protein
MNKRTINKIYKLQDTGTAQEVAIKVGISTSIVYEVLKFFRLMEERPSVMEDITLLYDKFNRLEVQKQYPEYNALLHQVIRDFFGIKKSPRKIHKATYGIFTAYSVNKFNIKEVIEIDKKSYVVRRVDTCMTEGGLIYKYIIFPN